MVITFVRSTVMVMSPNRLVAGTDEMTGVGIPTQSATETGLVDLGVTVGP